MDAGETGIRGVGACAPHLESYPRVLRVIQRLDRTSWLLPKAHDRQISTAERMPTCTLRDIRLLRAYKSNSIVFKSIADMRRSHVYLLDLVDNHFVSSRVQWAV